MKRGTYHGVAVRNAAMLERILALKADHPFWGYRRIWAHLRFVDGLEINQKRVYRLMQHQALLVKANVHLKACRTPPKSKPKPDLPNQWWGIDMTKVMTDSGWAYVVIVLDWHSKKVVGHYAGEQSKAWHWLIALNYAVCQQFPHGVREATHDLHLMADNGCQPTSSAFMQAVSALGIKLAFTSYNNPKGNADTERFMRTLKEEFAWLREWPSVSTLATELDAWVKHYNAAYLHSALGYTSPESFEQRYLNINTPNTLLKLAC